ncbi:hypothetical protein MKMG_02180 [Methanogenium sp. MK-MG]|nr:hypothetical protein MKMG_02180 [Methanogenium sp. MK-MG]
MLYEVFEGGELGERSGVIPIKVYGQNHPLSHMYDLSIPFIIPGSNRSTTSRVFPFTGWRF